MIKINADDLINRLQIVRDNIAAKDFSNELYSAYNAATKVMSFRIFNTGNDALGLTLGQYKGGEIKKKNRKKIDFTEGLTAAAVLTHYMKKRVLAGRQIVFKDLEFTGSLRRSIKPLKSEEKNKIEVTIEGDDSVVIARAQEQQIGNIRAGLHPRYGKAPPADIFSFSQSEKDFAVKELKTLISLYLKEQFSQAGIIQSDV